MPYRVSPVHDSLSHRRTEAAVAGSRSVGLHVAAVVTLCFTFPLIFLGGLVTSHKAGLSVPDWPNSYGYNMFLFPPRFWTGGILFEHTHRLLGTVVGFCATVMTLVAWGPARTVRGRKILIGVLVGLEAVNAIGTTAMWMMPGAFGLPETARSAAAIFPQGAVTAVGIFLTIAVAWFCRRPEPRRSVRWLATGCLVAVCVQGLLGGLRVDLVNLTLAIVHGCFAQLTFCLILLTAIVTGRWWARRAPSPGTPGEGGGEGGFEVPAAFDFRRNPHPNPLPAYRETGPERRRLTAFAFFTVAVIYCQLIVGAIMRHNQAGLAIPDLPLAYGHVLPPTTAVQLAADNHWRVWQLGLDPVTMPQVWIHFAHRIGAVTVSLFVLTLAGWILFRPHYGLSRQAVWLVLLLLLQVTLGILTVYYRKPADVTSAHVATGALLLATAVRTAVRSTRNGVMETKQLAALAARERQPALV
jgi:cytochrome c oxidase assembly protein subunit 15